MPNRLLIKSKTTRLDLKPRPVDGGETTTRGELVVRLAIMECYTWLGIGGRSGRAYGPKRPSKEISVALDVTAANGGGGGGPDYLRFGDDCRRLISCVIKHLLREEEEEYRYLTPACWDKAVPSGIERALAAAVAGGGGTCEVSVDISVRFEFVYSEQEALMLAFVDNDNDNGGGGDSACGWRSGGGGDGDAPLCPICFEEMSREADEVTDLPGCTHGFHRWCIAAWFYKASTCPVCRRDQLLYLPPDYDLRRLRAVVMTGRGFAR